ncbi:TIGR02679 domain-containing protein [Streptomyces sp. NPDC001617]
MRRCELATYPTYSAHGLDDGTPPARLILRGVATAQDAGLIPPESACRPEQSWLQTEGSIRKR